MYTTRCCSFAHANRLLFAFSPPYACVVQLCPSSSTSLWSPFLRRYWQPHSHSACVCPHAHTHACTHTHTLTHTHTHTHAHAHTHTHSLTHACTQCPGARRFTERQTHQTLTCNRLGNTSPSTLAPPSNTSGPLDSSLPARAPP